MLGYERTEEHITQNWRNMEYLVYACINSQKGEISLLQSARSNLFFSLSKIYLYKKFLTLGGWSSRYPQIITVTKWKPETFHLILFYHIGRTGMHMFLHWFFEVFPSPCSRHLTHLLRNCTNSIEGSVTSFASKRYNFLCNCDNLFSILLSSEVIDCTCKFGFTDHLSIWAMSTCFNCAISI